MLRTYPQEQNKGTKMKTWREKIFKNKSTYTGGPLSKY